MRKLFTLIALFMSVATSSIADVFVTEYMSVTKGSQVKGSIKADTYYVISGIDQSSREHYLYDNGGRVKGSLSFPSDSESTSSYIWTLQSSGTSWVVVNVGTGKKMNLGSSNGSAISMSDTEQANAIHFDSNGYVTILNSNGQSIDMTANGANPTTWAGTATPSGSRRLKIYEVDDVKIGHIRSLSLLPLPKHATVGEGEFVLRNGFAISVGTFSNAEEQNAVLADVARFITTINESTGLGCQASAGQADLNISENTEIAPEGYIMDISTDGVEIQASTSDGVYYAMQSLMRLLPPNVILAKEGEPDAVYSLPVARIEDEPRFAYRGFMLDVSRHFFTIEQIKKMLDLMAIYKMNVFHWHLTDDQGWRAEIKQYPLLTTAGAERKSSYDTPITKVVENGQTYWTGEGAQTNRKYGPFYYTQEEMKDIVRYAAERHIDVLPEVDMPGHFVAALAAYPQYSCHPNRAPEVWINGGISADVLNVADPEAVQFAKNIITELCAIFPYPYFHIGGDECPTSQWESNALCQEKLRQLGKSSFRALQTEFIREINVHLASLGKKMFCWNESITESGADLDLMKQSGATIMCWNPCQSGAAKAASLGLDAIITEWGSGCYYINRKQSNDYGEPTAAGGGNDNVEATYNYIPVPSSVSSQAAKHYIGVQGTFWAEHVSSNEYLEYLALPRLMCIAEAGWTPQEHKSWPSFVRRMTLDTKMLDLGGYIYARHWMDDYVPRKAPASVISAGSVVTFTNKSTDRGQCLADNDGTLNGQGSACTEWTLEAGSADGKFYIRSNVSGKYLYASNGNSGTVVELSDSKTEWAFDTSTIPGYVAICYNATSGNAINNNVDNSTNARLFAHGAGNGASFWSIASDAGNRLEDGETGMLTYTFYYRGISVGKKEFSLEKGKPYPSFAEYVPNGYVALSGDIPEGSITLKSHAVEIPVERVPETGRYYHFYNSVIGKYISADAALPQTYSTKDAGPYTLFYYDKNGLLSYGRGQYLQGADLADIGETGAEITILPSRTGVLDMYNIISDNTDYIRIHTADTLANVTGNSVSAGKAKAYDFRSIYAISLPVRLDENGWATFSSALPVTIPHDCVAYVVEGYEPATSSVSLRSIMPGTVVAANTGILLHGTPSVTIEMKISERGLAYSGNLLRPAVAAMHAGEDARAYILVNNNGVLSFSQINGTDRFVPSHSSWLSLDDSTAPQSISIVMPGSETSVVHVTGGNTGNDIIYNIHGQEMRKPQGGINIINGRKVVVRQ